MGMGVGGRLSHETVAELRRRLEAERLRLQGALAPRGEPESERVGELSRLDNHPGERSGELFEAEKDETLRALRRRRLERVEEALARMASGAYGICRRCGAPIPRERLEAVPWTALCAGCEEAMGEVRAPDGLGTPPPGAVRDPEGMAEATARLEGDLPHGERADRTIFGETLFP
jgi:RNA polymerase-binding transcription factor DksA